MVGTPFKTHPLIVFDFRCSLVCSIFAVALRPNRREIEDATRVVARWRRQVGLPRAQFDFPFCAFGCFLRHKHVTDSHAPIKVAEITGLGEFTEFVVFDRQLPVMFCPARIAPHIAPPKPSPSVRGPGKSRPRRISVSEHFFCGQFHGAPLTLKIPTPRQQTNFAFLALMRRNHDD
jgi:hypothetical protein